MRRSIFTVWLCLLAQLFAAPIWASGLTLCVADDGHVALERGHPDRYCATDLARHHPGETAADCGDPTAHRCKDLPLLEAGWGNAPASAFNAPTPFQLANALLAVLPLTPPHLHLVSAFSAIGVSPRILHAVRIVVLRV